MKAERNKAKERARKLIDALVGGDLGAHLHARLRDWFLNIPENGIAEEAFAGWVAQNMKPDGSTPGEEEKERFRHLAALLDNGEYESCKGAARRRSVFPRRLVSRVAAVLVPVLIAGGAALFILDRMRVENIVLYANDDTLCYEKFTLPDGSTVSLEHGSRLVYRGDFVSDRNVMLDGEAFFNVIRDSLHPFTVHNENLNVIVLGTKFKVAARNEIPQAEVILISGSVAVEIGKHHMELYPKQKLVLDKSKPSVLKLSELGPGTMMRYTRSDLVIDNIQAMEAFPIVADYFGKKLVVEPGTYTDDRLNIVLPKDAPIETAIRCLNKLAETINFCISGDTIYVSQK